MSALLAMQLDTMIVLMFVLMAVLFRFMIKQLSYSLHYKWQCERQIEAYMSRAALLEPSDLVANSTATTETTLQPA